MPRESIEIAPEKSCPSCGGEQFRQISTDISESLEYVLSSFKVIRQVRPRCACVACETIVQGLLPSKPIDKGKAGPGLLAHLLVQKYCNHLPIYRQAQIYAREGIELSRSTMTGWARQYSELLEPLVAELKKSVLSSSSLHGDDTPVRVLAPGLGKTETGRIWAYVRDGRPHGSEEPPAVVYYYSPDRKGSRPQEHLANYQGILHADAYAGYNDLYISADKPEATVTEAACWAHTRRKFYEIAATNDKASIALNVLEQIAAIYQIEAEIRGRTPAERLEHRQAHSKKLVEDLFANFKKYRTQLAKKSSTMLAINYAFNQQQALMRFLNDGQIEIDNNAAERTLRPIAIGRKNWLFAGSNRGGLVAANIYSLTETTKLNNINPWRYLQKVLTVIQDHKVNRSGPQKLDRLLRMNI